MYLSVELCPWAVHACRSSSTSVKTGRIVLYELAIGMHVCMGRFAQLHIVRGRVCARFNPDEVNLLICYFVFRLQCIRAGTPERDKLY